uniref:Uncharacterized protein n=1 Tax=Catharus ustulatus TaxID=91951 RepID=A0A8C3U357_CATUS
VPSCRCLLWGGAQGRREVGKGHCAQFFYEKTPPSDALRPTNAARICQFYDNKYRFATLYDRNKRIPVYSAYIYQPGPGNRYDTWFAEAQVSVSLTRDIIDTYGITSADIAKTQAIDQDYSAAQGLERCQLCPSGHQTSDDNKNSTFTLTNIVPLYTILNQGAWKHYGDITMAQKTQGCDTTYVITGAVPGNTDISNGRVNVPSHIWLAACCLKGKNPFRAWGAMAVNDRDSNLVMDLELWDLEKNLAGLYGKLDITLLSHMYWTLWTLLQAEHARLSQPLSRADGLQPSEHLHGLHWTPLQQLWILLELWAPELEAALQLGSQQSRAQGDKCPVHLLCCFLVWCVCSSVPQGTSSSAQRHKAVARACSCFALLPISGESSQGRVLSSLALPDSVQLTCPSPPQQGCATRAPQAAQTSCLDISMSAHTQTPTMILDNLFCLTLLEPGVWTRRSGEVPPEPNNSVIM